MEHKHGLGSLITLVCMVAFIYWWYGLINIMGPVIQVLLPGRLESYTPPRWEPIRPPCLRDMLDDIEGYPNK